MKEENLLPNVTIKTWYKRGMRERQKVHGVQRGKSKLTKALEMGYNLLKD